MQDYGEALILPGWIWVSFVLSPVDNLFCEILLCCPHQQLVIIVHANGVCDAAMLGPLYLMVRYLECARRMLRLQSFVRSAETDLQRREERAAAALSALGPKQQRQLSTEEAQAFYDRLLEDSEHRLRNRWADFTGCQSGVTKQAQYLLRLV